jgi:hypothetical protein
MTNPDNNFVTNTASFTPAQIVDLENRRSFHVSTYTLDLKQLSLVVPSPDLATSLPNVANTVISNPEKYLKVIDEYTNTDIKAQLKCRAPCLRCLDADPDFCTACWGINQLSHSGNGNFADSAADALIFLQADQGAQTCKSQCDLGSTTDGQKMLAYTDSTQKLVDDTKTYYKCAACDMFCAACRGQGVWDGQVKRVDYGAKGDTTRCVSCS